MLRGSYGYGNGKSGESGKQIHRVPLCACITRLEAQGASMPCNVSEEEEEAVWVGCGGGLGDRVVAVAHECADRGQPRS